MAFRVPYLRSFFGKVLLIAAVGSGVVPTHGQDRFAGIYTVYQQQAEKASKSGFAYHTYAERQRDLAAIDKQIAEARRQGTDHTAGHSKQYKVLIDGRNRVANTPVDPSGGTGAWSGDQASRVEAAQAFLGETVKVMQEMHAYIDKVEEDTRKQIIADNAYYDAATSTGKARLESAGKNALKSLDDLDSQERAAHAKIRRTSPSSRDRELQAIQQMLSEMLDSMLPGDPENSSSIRDLPPCIKDSSAEALVRDINSFKGLDPSRVVPAYVSFGLHGFSPPIDPNADPNALGPDPRTLPWGIYTGDTICDGRDGIWGVWRTIAIDAYDRKKARLLSQGLLAQEAPPDVPKPFTLNFGPPAIPPPYMGPLGDEDDISLLGRRTKLEYREPDPEFDYPPHYVTPGLPGMIDRGIDNGKAALNRLWDKVSSKFEVNLKLKPEYQQAYDQLFGDGGILRK